jgi:hypothetical protein
MTRRGPRRLIAVVAAALLLLGACESGDDDDGGEESGSAAEGGEGGTAESGETIRIAFSAPGADHGWLAAITENAEEEAARYDDVEFVLLEGTNDSAAQVRWLPQEPLVAIGTAETPRHSVLGYVMDIAVDRNGNVYVVDESFFNVRVFDANGNFLASVGRRGDGPGEFRVPLKAVIDAQAIVHVLDADGRISMFELVDGVLDLVPRSRRVHGDRAELRLLERLDPLDERVQLAIMSYHAAHYSFSPGVSRS